MKGKIRVIAGFAIVATTIAAFIWYVSKNPQILDQLSQTSITVVVTIAVLYAGILGVLVLVLYASLQFYKRHMSGRENFLLNAYSSLINFFGPGQSGPSFRAAYLKLKHDVKIKQYIFVTLLYYAFYAFFSGVLLAFAAFDWWITLGLLLLIVLVCYVVLKYFLTKNKNLLNRPVQELVKPFFIIGAATLLQVLLLWAIYFVELRSLDPSISLGQAATYTGAANFALFVALTPGAIGFREAFLVFSQNLHHIPNDIIVAANILDRAVYILFLGILFLIVLALHANKTLQVRSIQAEAKKENN
jgi:uncharacterized membrane protein YbhN (UPF0104 family)